MPSFWTQTDRISAPLSAGRTLRRLSRLLSASSTVCSLTECRDVHWAQAPRRAITDPLRCQADMGQLPTAAGPGHRPFCRVTANPPRTNTAAEHCWRLRIGGFQNSFSISRTWWRGILNGDLRCSRFSLRRSRLSSAKWQVSCHAVPEDSTSLFELCLQHGAAEKRFRAVKPQTAAWKSGSSVSTLPDAAVIEFDSGL